MWPTPSQLHDFFFKNQSYVSRCPQGGTAPKNEPPFSLKNEPPFWEMIPRRKSKYQKLLMFLFLSAISCPRANFGSLLRKKPHSTYVNHSASISFYQFYLLTWISPVAFNQCFLGAPLHSPTKFWRASPYGEGGGHNPTIYLCLWETLLIVLPAFPD